MKDYYKILGVSETANKDELKKAFRGLAKNYHPDRNKENENALRMFQEVNEAYEVLSNESSREEYDGKRNSKQFNQKKNENKKSENSNNSTENYDKNDAINNLNQYFESFFGFNAKSNDIDKSKLKKKNNNPIDTSDIFDNFFNIKK